MIFQTNQGLGLDASSPEQSTAVNFDWSLVSGATVESLILGLAVIWLGFSGVFSGEKRNRKTEKKWASGAWRDLDYEELSPDFTTRRKRK